MCPVAACGAKTKKWLHSAPFSYNKLAEPFGISDKTAKEYTEALEEAFLLTVVDQHSFSERRQIRSPKKVYLIDPGLAQAIAFKFSENRGKILENAVFLELMRRYQKLYYTRTDQDYEVDFIAQDGASWLLVQVCASLHKDALERELRALKAAAAECRCSRALIITLEQDGSWEFEGLRVIALPFFKWALDSSD